MGRPKKGKIEGSVAWYEIPGFDGRYQISRDGVVRSLMHKEPRILTARPNPGKCNAVTVQLSRPGKPARHEKVLQLMVRTFYPNYDRKLKPYHRDGNTLNNALSNIAFGTQSQIGKRFGGKYVRRPVCKVDWYGHVMETYPSIAEAGRANYIASKSIWDRCRGRLKDPYLPGGYTFVYLDTVIRMGKEWQ